MINVLYCRFSSIVRRDKARGYIAVKIEYPDETGTKVEGIVFFSFDQLENIEGLIMGGDWYALHYWYHSDMQTRDAKVIGNPSNLKIVEMEKLPPDANLFRFTGKMIRMREMGDDRAEGEKIYQFVVALEEGDEVMLIRCIVDQRYIKNFNSRALTNCGFTAILSYTPIYEKRTGNVRIDNRRFDFYTMKEKATYRKVMRYKILSFAENIQ